MSDDRLRLEARLAEDPDDVELWKVYADHLQHSGDPRGELIVLQIAADAERALKLKHAGPAIHAARKYLAKHSAVFLGPLAAAAKQEGVLAWRHGFLHRIVVDNRSGPTLLDAVLSHPSGRFVSEIVVRGSLTGVAESFARHPMSALRDLEVFAPEAIELPWERFTHVRRLSLTGKALDLTDLAAPMTLRATFASLVLEPHAMRAIAQAPWPVVERLEIRLGTEAPFTPFEEVAPLLRRTDLPMLRSLKLRQAPYAGAILRELATSPLGAQLEVIDLSHGQLTPQDVIFVADRKQAFRALRELWVPTSATTGDAGKRLAGIAKHVVPDRKAPVDRLEQDLRYDLSSFR